MRPIQDVLNKVKWDKSQNPKDFTVEFLDFGNLKSVPYENIKRIEGEFMIVEIDGKEVDVPLHRVRIVRQKGEIVWRR